MKRHFRKRVSYLTEGKYLVQYAYYNIIPIWHTLNFWYEVSMLSGTEGWTPNMWKYEYAVKMAESLKSIEDVHVYYAPMKEQEKAFYKNKKEYLAKNVPCMQKEIK